MYSFSLENSKLAVIGLGYVGLPLAVEFGKHRPVVGFDINTKRIEALQAGHDSTLEVSDEELAEAGELQFSSSLSDLEGCNTYIVTVPTPIDEHKRPDLTPLIKASETIGKVLKPGDVVIYESTVYPGATEEDCVPVLERISGLKFNFDFFAGYRPAQGADQSAVRRIQRLADAYTGILGAQLHTWPDTKPGAANVPASSFLRPSAGKLRHLQPLHLRQIEKQMSRAARDGKMFHLWWHPHNFGVNTDENLAGLDRLLTHFNRLNRTHGMQSLTMAEAA